MGLCVFSSLGGVFLCCREATTLRLLPLVRGARSLYLSSLGSTLYEVTSPGLG